MKNLAEKAQTFSLASRHYCSIVDLAPTFDRSEFLLEIYRALPILISEAMALPLVELPETDEVSVNSERRMTMEEWGELYESLKAKLGDWNLYKKVFDPTSDDTDETQPILGSLADDIADIYRDVRAGLVVDRTRDVVWTRQVFHWRVLFYSHWGKHAIDALDVIHSRMSESLG